MDSAFSIIISILGIVSLTKSIYVIKQFERGIVIRFGKYHRLIQPGINFIFPFLDSVIKVDVRERVINVDPQKVITKDNVTVEVDAVIYYKVVDPVKAEFEVEDFDYAATTLAQTNLRNIIGDKTLDETLVARDIINENLRDVLDEATNNWGVKITRVEVQKIDPPVEITDAMSLQMKAEREKRAMILKAEGIKQSQILEAEGKKEKQVLEAQGQAQAIALKAQAEAKAIEMVSHSANLHFKDNAQVWKQFETARETLAKNVKYIIPNNAQLINLLGLDTSVKEKSNES
ncbi:MAG: paraslipin [Patescibacteria group bacterium]|nr:MAG: paraslipin [Patescibacteria group bacterium]